MCGLTTPARPTSTSSPASRCSREQSLVRILRRPARRRPVRDARDDPRVRRRAAGRGWRDRSSTRSAIATPGVSGWTLAAAATLNSADRGRTLDRLEDDHDNLRAAIDHAIDTADCEQASGPARPLGSASGTCAATSWRAAPAPTPSSPWTAGRRSRRSPACGRSRSPGGLAYWAGDIPAAYGHYEAAEREARASATRRRSRTRSTTGSSHRRPRGPWSSGRTRSRTTGLPDAREALGDQRAAGRPGRRRALRCGRWA